MGAGRIRGRIRCRTRVLTVTSRVHLVIDADRHVLDVCADEETAAAIAHAMNATHESWPITRSPRAIAWHRARLTQLENGARMLATVEALDASSQPLRNTPLEDGEHPYGEAPQ